MTLLPYLLLVLVAQLCITRADVFAKKMVAAGPGQPRWRWLSTYAPTRLTGLLLRLLAVFAMPVGAAATLFAMSAITVSTAAAHSLGERFSRYELIALGLIAAAAIARGLA